ncbi:restriction endonuclease subunit S [Trichococcus sp. K1Tr]|uniref:restriction endonuclease subunit S n=1 Tax=Trichococcus sp. K1Tr TaxID=3020847 RepID=UPI00232EE6E7|nr:restriction endonuclease subunit S [Trichococcus sp. K1Tr]MDB6353914.1 restriction endonuclease subunit S [Trichococcus sp. K1Tr]
MSEHWTLRAWEQRKLGEISDIVGGGTPSTSTDDYWNGNIDWYSPAEIGNQIFVKGSQKRITKAGLQKSSAKILPVGTVLFTSRAGIGKTAILAKEGATNQGFQSIVPHENELDSYFIYSRTHELKQYGETIGAGSTFIEVSGKQMAKMPMLMPRLQEQIQIGTFFKKLDDTFALHQRKLDLLNQLKQTFLQVMFPHNGWNIPTLRFDGFSEPWEPRKLIEMANFRRGSFPQPYGEKKWYDETNGMPFVQVVDVGNNLRLVNNTKQKISKLAQPKSVFVEAGKVVVTLQGSIGRVAITQYPSYVDRTLLIFESYKQPIDEYYFAYVIQQLFEIEKRTAPGGTIKTITKEVLSDFLIHIPEFDEQKSLGNYFRKLDDTIDLHQQKIDNIQSLKSTLLNKMFI